MYRQVAILGTSIDVVTMSDTLNLIESFIRDGQWHQIATANTDFLVKALQDAELRTALDQCDMIVPDGMPLLWASRLMGVPMPERVTGADLVPKLGELSAQKGWRLFLLGGTAEASERAEASLRKKYHGVKIAGRLSPPAASLENMDNGPIIEEIHRARPDILLVAFGNPKQEKWIHRHRKDLRVPVSIGVGAALDFIGGSVPRAPCWMQRSGLEWLHRAITEPRRLGRRYLVDAVRFSQYLAMQLVANGSMSPRRESLTISRYNFAGKAVLQLKGNLAGDELKRLEEDCRDALRPGGTVIIDLTAASAIGADALAVLMNLKRSASWIRGELILTGVTPRIERILRLSQAASHFRMVHDVIDALAEGSSAAAQVRLDLVGESVVCSLEGEFSGNRAKAVMEVCDQLARSFAEVTINAMGLTEASRGLFPARTTLTRAEKTAPSLV